MYGRSQTGKLIRSAYGVYTNLCDPWRDESGTADVGISELMSALHSQGGYGT